MASVRISTRGWGPEMTVLLPHAPKAPPQTSTTSLLMVRDLEVRFFTKRGVVEAVNGVSFSLAPGERMAIVGESGSGKSVMTSAFMRLVAHPGRITNGQVLLSGQDL